MPTDDYIKRSDALEAMMTCRSLTGVAKLEAVNHIMPIPAADVELVRPGWWVSKEGIYGVVYCSICDFELKIDNTPRCPNCGAKMGVEPPKEGQTDE